MCRLTSRAYAHLCVLLLVLGKFQTALENSSSFRRAIGADLVPHRTVAALPFVPHPQQHRVAGVHEVDDPHFGLAGLLPV